MKKFLFILPLFILSCDDYIEEYFPDLGNCGYYYAFYRTIDCPDSEGKKESISYSEYERLMEVLDNSTEDCVWVTINPTYDREPIEGYLRNTTNPGIAFCQVGW